MSKRNRINIARIKSNDWYIGKEGMETLPNHSTRKLNGMRVGRRRNGVIVYKLSNKKHEELGLEIRHLLNTKQFLLRKGHHIEPVNGIEMLRRWKNKGIIDVEGHVADISVDLLKQGEKIFI